MSLNVSTFEGNIDLNTIPANRTWAVAPVSPVPFYVIGTNKNVQIKKIEVGATYNSLAPNDNIILENWSTQLGLLNRDRTVLRPIIGSVSTITSGVFTGLAPLNSILLPFSQSSPIIDFGDDYILAGGLSQAAFTLKFSNIITPLNTVLRYYINIYWIEPCS